MFGSIIAGVLLPVINGLVTAWNKSKDVAIEGLKATGTIAAAQASYMTAALGHPLSPVSICCYGVAIWFFKATAIDKVIGPAFGYSLSTDPLGGGTAEIAMIVVSGMFFSAITRVIKS